MQPFNVHLPRSSKGFTLIETLIVIIVVGILSAIAAPSFLTLYRRTQVNEALTKVQGALQEAQREAMRRSKSCTVSIPSGNDITISTTSTSGCLITGSRVLGDPSTTSPDIQVELVPSTSPWVITFDFKGRYSASTGTVIVSHPDVPSFKKCLVLSPGLGLMRTGEYSNSTCTTTQ